MQRDIRRTLRRSSPRREPRQRVLVLCEGEVTEPKYLKALRHEYRSQLVDVEVVPDCGVPKTLVESAVARKKDAERQARRWGDPYLKYDEVWCVFDVDAHPNLAEAKQQARDNGLYVALSNPCFEVWILLHFRDQRAHQERGRIQEACREYLPGYAKEVPYDRVREHYAAAVQRADALLEWQRQQGRPEGNPTTLVHRLTERIVSLGKDEFLRT